jgi:hypothetical protein
MDNENQDDEIAPHVWAMAELSNNNNELIDWDYWAGKMPRWTAHQAVRLMAALDPTRHNDLAFRPNETAGAAKEQAKRLETLATSFGMTEATPLEWSAWAEKVGEPVHGGLRAALEKLTNSTANGDEDRNLAVLGAATGPDEIPDVEARSAVAWRRALEKQWQDLLMAHGNKCPEAEEALAWLQANDTETVFAQMSTRNRGDDFVWIGANSKRHTTTFKTFQNVLATMRRKV